MKRCASFWKKSGRREVLEIFLIVWFCSCCCARKYLRCFTPVEEAAHLSSVLSWCSWHCKIILRFLNCNCFPATNHILAVYKYGYVKLLSQCFNSEIQSTETFRYKHYTKVNKNNTLQRGYHKWLLKFVTLKWKNNRSRDYKYGANTLDS